MIQKQQALEYLKQYLCNSREHIDERKKQYNISGYYILPCSDYKYYSYDEISPINIRSL